MGQQADVRSGAVVGDLVAGHEPAGHGPHRYVITVHALDTENIGVPADATPANLGFTMAGHILGRATLIATGETP